MKRNSDAGSSQNAPLSEKRHFSRVVTNHSNRLLLDGEYYVDVKIRDLSVSGGFIEGHFGAKVCDKCVIELYKTGRDDKPVLRLSARIIRVEDSGLAVKFVNMKDDSLMFLQTVVLYSTDDPVKVAGEFTSEINIFGDDNRR